jgi:hypothetical protein
MARKKSAEITEKVELTGLERLGLRVSAMIQSPISQMNRSVLIHRLDTDEDEAWDGVMGLLAETDGLHLLFDDDGNVMVSWEREEGGVSPPVREDESVTEAEIPF